MAIAQNNDGLGRDCRHNRADYDEDEDDNDEQH